MREWLLFETTLTKLTPKKSAYFLCLAMLAKDMKRMSKASFDNMLLVIRMVNFNGIVHHTVGLEGDGTLEIHFGLHGVM